MAVEGHNCGLLGWKQKLNKKSKDEHDEADKEW